MKLNIGKLAALAFLAGTCGSVSAQTVTIGTTTVPNGSTSAVVPITFTAGASVVSYQVDFTFTRSPPVVASGSVTTANIDGTCSGNAITTLTGTALRATDIDLGNVPLPSGTTCNLTFPLDPAAPVGNYPFTVTFSEFNTASGTVTGTVTNGAIVIAAVSSPTVTFNPATGPINFPPGGSGTTSAPIPITIDGTGGTAATSTGVACAFSPAAPGLAVTGGPFTINDGDPAGDVDGTFNLTCTYAAGTPRTGTLACTTTPSIGTGTTTNYTVNCPAGGATPPTVTYNPAAGSTITFNGATGPINQSIAVTQTAAGQAGTSVVVGQGGCTLGGANPGNFTATVNPNPITFTGGAANAGGSIGVTCTSNATATTATLSCPETTDNGTGPTTVQRTWNLNCPVPSANIVTTPPNGGTLGLSAAPGTTASGNIVAQNTGFAPLTISGCTITGAGAASFGTPTVPAAIAAGGSGNIGVSCTTPGAGGQSVSATLTCQTNAANAATISYTLNCTAILLSIPTLGLLGKTLLGLMVLGLGLIGFRMSRRFA